MGLFTGKRPDGLGWNAGKLKPCSRKPNCVSSTTDPNADAAHFIEPLKISGDPVRAWSTLTGIIKAAPQAHVVRADAGYLQAEYSSKMMGYTDDVEFALDAGRKLIHVRSASRLGIRDFGVNRARIEDIRSRMAAAGK